MTKCYIILIILTILALFTIATVSNAQDKGCSDRAYKTHKSCVSLAKEVNSIKGNEDLYTYKELEAINKQILACTLFWYKDTIRANNCDRRLAEDKLR
jgi:hypothetical protein